MSNKYGYAAVKPVLCTERHNDVNWNIFFGSIWTQTTRCLICLNFDIFVGLFGISFGYVQRTSVPLPIITCQIAIRTKPLPKGTTFSLLSRRKNNKKKTDNNNRTTKQNKTNRLDCWTYLPLIGIPRYLKFRKKNNKRWLVFLHIY